MHSVAITHSVVMKSQVRSESCCLEQQKAAEQCDETTEAALEVAALMQPAKQVFQTAVAYHLWTRSQLLG